MHLSNKQIFWPLGGIAIAFFGLFPAGLALGFAAMMDPAIVGPAYRAELFDKLLSVSAVVPLVGSFVMTSFGIATILAGVIPVPADAAAQSRRHTRIFIASTLIASLILAAITVCVS